MHNKEAGFSRFERNGIILLSLLIILAIVSKKYITEHIADSDETMKNDMAEVARLRQQIDAAKDYYGSYASQNTDKPAGKSTDDATKTGPYGKTAYADLKIEVNSANAEEYEKLYGIGKVFAARIVTFRDKLGGFYSVEQLKDVYGIEDSVFQKFKKNLTIKPVKAKKININTATYEELTANPYFFSTIAKQIIGYRTKVKPFASVEDIKNLYFVRDHPDQFNKLSPYIVVE